MRRKDIRTVLELLTNDLKHHTIIYPIFTQEEAEHILLPRDNVIVSYVREIDGERI